MAKKTLPVVEDQLKILEGAVYAVLEGFEVVYLNTQNGGHCGFAPKNFGMAFEDVKVGDRFRCVLNNRTSRLVSVTRLPDL